MAGRSAKDWFEIVALVSVMGGLALVAYEIRQANFFAKAATVNSIYEGWETLAMSQIESRINEVRIKAIEDPESLSATELADISSFLTAVISIYQRNGIMYYEYGLASDPMYADAASFYFPGHIARDWFDVNESWIRSSTPELADEIRHYIETTPVDSSFNSLNYYKAHLTN